MSGLVLRHLPTGDDRAAIRDVVASTGVFSAEEIEVAVELLDERLARGEASGYEFIFAESRDHVAGYACYGAIPATAGSFDLYWIAVDAAQGGRGIGTRLIAAVEREVVRRGGLRLFVETSSRGTYAPARAFYERCGYTHVATLPDYFAAGDDEIVYRKEFATAAPPA